MARAPKPQPGIMEIDLYVGGDARIDGVDDILKLSSNENPRGASPAAVAAIHDVAADAARYPSSDHRALRTAIAETHGLDPDRIICGAGSDEIIAFLCQAYAGPGDEVLFTEHGFLMYRISAHAAGATPVEVGETDRTTDVDKLLAGVTPRTRLVFIANPNNPTGTMIGGQDLARLADGLPDGALLVLDSAYAEFEEGYDGGASLVDTRDNVVMTRTFSKIYGLGGLRVGWGYGPREVIDVLTRVRGPFNVSSVGLVAAEAAVRDRDFADACRAENATVRADLQKGLADLGIPSDPSHANFVLARFAEQATAAACDAALRARGIIVRRVTGYGFPEGLRITVPARDDLDRVLEAFATFMAEREAAE